MSGPVRVEVPLACAPSHGAVRRFVMDAIGAGSIAHPGLAPVYSAGVDGTSAWWTSEPTLQTLATRLAGRGLGAAEALSMGAALAAALACAHEHGLVHGRITAEHVHFGADGRARLAGFGLSALAPETEPLATVQGDLSALGQLLRSCLGRLPDDLAGLLSKDPSGRPASAREVVPILRALAARSASRRRRIGSTIAGVGALVTLGVVALALAGPAPPGQARRAAGASGTAAARIPPPRYRRLTSTRGHVLSARFAPDAKTVLFGASWDGGPYRLYRAGADALGARAVDLPPADVLSIARSGELAVSLDRHYTLSWWNEGTLARGWLGGGPLETLLAGVQEACWTPDGRLAIVRIVEGHGRLELPAGTVLHETSGWLSHARVSREGDRIAFFEHPQPGDNRGRVVVLDADRRLRVLSDGWGSLTGLAWSPSGEEVWWSGAEHGAHWIFAASPGEKERLVARGPADLTLHDVAPDGRALVATDDVRVGIRGVFPGDVDEREVGWLDFSVVADLSQDGRHILFSEQGRTEGTLYGTYYGPTDASAAPVRLGDGLALALSPDERWALTLRLESPTRIVLLPTGAGAERVVPTDGLAVSDARFLPDATAPEGVRVLVRADTGDTSRYLVQDLDGSRRVDLPFERASWAVASPDGRHVAVLGGDSAVWIVPLAPRGTARRLPSEARTGWTGRPVQWSADGRAVFVADLARGARVHRVDVATGRARPWRDIQPSDRIGLLSVPFLVMNRDATAYAYSYAQIDSQLHLVEGLR